MINANATVSHSAGSSDMQTYSIYELTTGEIATVRIAFLTSADDPEVAAVDAGLRYVSDQEPGIRRRRRGRGFSYHDDDGKAVRHDSTLERIKRLAVPPALLARADELIE